MRPHEKAHRLTMILGKEVDIGKSSLATRSTLLSPCKHWSLLGHHIYLIFAWLTTRYYCLASSVSSVVLVAELFIGGASCHGEGSSPISAFMNGARM
jgi:hypothetical protein